VKALRDTKVKRSAQPIPPQPVQVSAAAEVPAAAEAAAAEPEAKATEAVEAAV
jgi:hypothetical protein